MSSMRNAKPPSTNSAHVFTFHRDIIWNSFAEFFDAVKPETVAFAILMFLSARNIFNAVSSTK